MTDPLSILRLPSPVQKLHSSFLKKHNIQLYVKRDDLIHPVISGNKWRKLKYNLAHAKESGQQTLLTFGGAYSNHIHATAALGELMGFNTIGIIRGELHSDLNATLSDALNWGMQLDYVSRTSYREKNSVEFIKKLKEKFGDFYLIPEGGNNELGAKGCKEIITELKLQCNEKFDTICVDCGTGTTMAGMINALHGQSFVLGFAVLKNADFLNKDINHHLDTKTHTNAENWLVNLDYHFGGFGKTSVQLFEFINEFKQTYNIQLDPVYTGKMFFGIFDLIRTGHFKSGEKILVIHTGGLQGIRGYSELTL